MSKVFYRKKFSDYLGEQRAILDIYAQNIPDPSPTPTPSPQPVSPTRTPTPTPTPSITPTITPTASVTPTITPTNTVTPTQTKSPTPTRTVTPTVTPTNTPSPTPDVLYQTSVVVESCDGNLYTGGIDVFVNGVPNLILPDGTTTGTTGCLPLYVGNGDSFIYQIQYAGSYTGCTSPGFVWDAIRYEDFQYDPSILPAGGYNYREIKYQGGVPLGPPVPKQAAINGPNTPTGCTPSMVDQWLDLSPVFYIQGGPAPTATPTPTPTVTPTGLACDFTYVLNPTPTPTPTSTVTPTVTSTPTVTPTPSSGPSIDPDAQAFINATGISGAEATAINTLVVDLKTAGLWTLIDAMYPFVGGTATSCKFNLKDPQDTNAAYRMTFNGSWTINSSGVVPSSKSSSNYGDSYWSPYGIGGNRNDSHHYYRYINGVYNVGCDYAGVASPYTIMGACQQLEWFDANGAASLGGIVAGTGGYSQAISRTASNSVDFYRQLQSGIWGNFVTLSNTGTQSTNSMYIGSVNGANFPEEMRYATLSYGQGLTSTQIGNLNTIVTTFNTTLSRNF